MHYRGTSTVCVVQIHCELTTEILDVPTENDGLGVAARLACNKLDPLCSCPAAVAANNVACCFSRSLTEVSRGWSGTYSGAGGGWKRSPTCGRIFSTMKFIKWLSIMRFVMRPHSKSMCFRSRWMNVMARGIRRHIITSEYVKSVPSKSANTAFRSPNYDIITSVMKSQRKQLSCSSSVNPHHLISSLGGT